MNDFLLVARLLLVAVFAVAGLAKLADLAGSRQAVQDFGVPQFLAAPLGLLLPLVEIGVAIALIPTRSAWAGAIGAAALLALFLLAIGVNLARGRAPDCHCFGQLHSEPAGWSTLGRNALLTAVAGFVIALGPNHTQLSAVAWVATLSSAEQSALGIALVALLLALAGLWLLVQLVAQNGRLLSRLEGLDARLTALPLALAGSVSGEGQGQATLAAAALPVPASPPVPQPGLPVGAIAPSFSLRGLYGETQTLDALRALARPLLLLFVDPHCGPCNALLPDVGRWQRELAPVLSLVLVSRGSVEENRPKAAEHGLSGILLQEDREVATAYQAYGTPGAVLVGADGHIASAVAQGAEQIKALVARAAGGGAFAAAPAVAGIPAGIAQPAAPPLQMPALAPAPLPGGNGNGNGLVPVPVLNQPSNGLAPCPHCGKVHAEGADTGGGGSAPGAERLGQPAPSLRLPDLDGALVDLADYRGRETAVLFWNPGCGFCQRLLPDLKAWEADRPARAPALLVVTNGGAAANAALGLASPLLLDESGSVASAFGGNGTPSAVLVGADGRIASPLAVGGPSVLALLRGEALPAAPAQAQAPPAAQLGQPAPEFSLPDLHGSPVSLSGFRGSPTLVLFWNPGCGFCQQMLDDLKRWEVAPPAGAPRLLVVSTGAAEANRILGLRSPIVLDANFGVGASFGASGTPSAVLVDAQGRIASAVAAGAPAVMALARPDA